MFKMIRSVILFVLAFCLIMAGIFGIGQLIPNQYVKAFTASAVDKYNANISRTEPAILLVGGSNVTFGMDSGLISEKTGMPVLNMGFHAGLKRDFELNFVKSNIMKGDIIILAFEYSAYKEDKMTQNVAWYTIDNHPELMKMIPASNRFDLFRYYPIYLLKKITDAVFNPYPEPSGEKYGIENFNEYGDVVINLNENIRTPDQIEKTLLVDGTVISDESVKALNDFKAYCEAKGAKVYASAPAVDELSLIKSKADMALFDAYYKAHIHIERISDSADYVYPTSYFYDTIYHLNTMGTRARSIQLAEDINKVLTDHA